MNNKNKIKNKYSCILSNIQRNPWPFWITHLSGDLTHISQHRSEDSHECCLASDIFLIFRSYQICPLSIIDLSIYQQHNTCWALACDFYFPVSISSSPYSVRWGGYRLHEMHLAKGTTRGMLQWTPWPQSVSPWSCRAAFSESEPKIGDKPFVRLRLFLSFHQWLFNLSYNWSHLYKISYKYIVSLN